MIKCNFFEPFLVLLNDGNKSIVPHGESFRQITIEINSFHYNPQHYNPHSTKTKQTQKNETRQLL